MILQKINVQTNLTLTNCDLRMKHDLRKIGPATKILVLDLRKELWENSYFLTICGADHDFLNFSNT